jgi:hypothetical protein
MCFEIKSVDLDEDFVEEMKKVSDGFWAQQMYNAVDQHDKDHGTEQVVKNLTNIIKNEPSRRSTKLVSASKSATKNISTAFRAVAGPIVDISQAGEKHEARSQAECSEKLLHAKPNTTTSYHPRCVRNATPCPCPDDRYFKEYRV